MGLLRKFASWFGASAAPTNSQPPTLAKLSDQDAADLYAFVQSVMPPSTDSASQKKITEMIVWGICAAASPSDPKTNPALMQVLRQLMSHAFAKPTTYPIKFRGVGKLVEAAYAEVLEQTNRQSDAATAVSKIQMACKTCAHQYGAEELALVAAMVSKPTGRDIALEQNSALLMEGKCCECGGEMARVTIDLRGFKASIDQQMEMMRRKLGL